MMFAGQVLKGPAKRKRPRRRGCVPLAAAAQLGTAECVALLLKAGAKVDAPCILNRPPRDEVRGCTALFAAAMMGDAKIVQMLLDAGANPSAKNAKGETSLDWA